MAAASLTGARMIVAEPQLLDTPSLVVDEGLLRRNIAEMQALAREAGVNLRPHMKTHKTPEIARLQIEAGAVGITCAKVGEAEVMVDEGGVVDVLLAYPTIGEPKIRRLLALMERVKITVALDSREAAAALSDAMVAAARGLDIYVEVNTGQNRAGAVAGDEAIALALDLARLPGLRLTGIMTHEGQANTAPPETIEAIALDAGQTLVATAERIRAHGIALDHVSVGSTPASRYTPGVAGITEMRPGTYVFNDTTAFRYGHNGPDDCAARFVVTVISRPAPDRAVIDAGSKTLALDKSHGHPGHGYIVGHPAAEIVRLSEEHGVVNLPPEDQAAFQVGDTLEVIPNHVCPALNLMDELLIARDGQIVDTWRIAARGKVR
jgi:D-serine deaminase-like pyridoxal phosphate-dependent protein